MEATIDEEDATTTSNGSKKAVDESSTFVFIGIDD